MSTSARQRPDGTCYLAATPIAAIIERVADPDLLEPIRPTIDELRRLVVWSGELFGQTSEPGRPPTASGELEPDDALAYLDGLPPGLQPTTVGHRSDFAQGPAPR